MKFRLFAVVPLAAHFTAAQIPATDNSYTSSSSAGNNYGTQSQLNVIGPGVNAYVRGSLKCGAISSEVDYRDLC